LFYIIFCVGKKLKFALFNSKNKKKLKKNKKNKNKIYIYIKRNVNFKTFNYIKIYKFLKMLLNEIKITIL